MAACLALLVLALPFLMNDLDMISGAGEKVEMDNVADAEPEMNGDAGGMKDEMEAPAEMETENESVSDEETFPTAAAIKLALREQGGAYPLGTLIENQHGTVMLSERTEFSVTIKVTLLADMPLSVISATSGTWHLTVNGKAATAFPSAAGTYEIVLDFSGDQSLDLLFIEGFGVFALNNLCE